MYYKSLKGQVQPCPSILFTKNVLIECTHQRIHYTYLKGVFLYFLYLYLYLYLSIYIYCLSSLCVYDVSVSCVSLVPQVFYAVNVRAEGGAHRNNSVVSRILWCTISAELLCKQVRCRRVARVARDRVRVDGWMGTEDDARLPQLHQGH